MRTGFRRGVADRAWGGLAPRCCSKRLLRKWRKRIIVAFYRGYVKEHKNSDWNFLASHSDLAGVDCLGTAGRGEGWGAVDGTEADGLELDG